jgi:hypothetical protein
MMKGWVCLLGIGFAFGKCTYCTCSTCLHGHGIRLFFPGSGQSDTRKSDNLQWWTSHGVWDVTPRAEPHLYVSLACSCLLSLTISPHLIALARTAQKTSLPLLHVLSLLGRNNVPQSCSVTTTVVLSPVCTTVTYLAMGIHSVLQLKCCAVITSNYTS